MEFELIDIFASCDEWLEQGKSMGYKDGLKKAVEIVEERIEEEQRRQKKTSTAVRIAREHRELALLAVLDELHLELSKNDET